MKLIKINTDHYVIVDDSEIKEGDYKYHHVKGIVKAICNGAYTNEFKITHSNQPLGKPMLFTNAFESDLAISTMGLHDTVIENWGCKKLALQEVKELIGEVDVEKKAERDRLDTGWEDSANLPYTSGFVRGYNQALADNKEFIKKPTEWNIEIDSSGKIKLK